MRLRFLLLPLILALAICSPLAAEHPHQLVTITVAQRDTLINLCNTYLTDPAKWSVVSKLNRLANPNLILPGQTISFPVELLKGLPHDGRVTFMAGDVSIQPKGRSEWNRLRQDDSIPEGSTLKTGSDGNLEVAASDGTAFLLRPNSVVTVGTSRQGKLHLLQRLSLQAGRVITRIKAATGRATRYEIQTPSSVAAARGTAFQVSLDLDRTSRSEVREGTVDVAGSGREVAVKSGEGTVVRLNQPPMEPRPLLPPPTPPKTEPQYRSLPITITPAVQTGAARARLLLAADQSMRHIVREANPAPGEAAVFDKLADGTYYLSQAGLDEAGLEGYPTEPLMVKLRANPFPPILQAPKANAVTSKKRLTVSWLRVTDAEAYRIQLADNSEFRSPLADAANLTATSWTTDALPPATYHYRILSRASDGYEGAWSATQTVIVVPPPTAPSLEKPDASGNSIRLRWNDQGPGTSYQVQLARDPAFTAMEADLAVQKAELLLPRPTESGTHYVRIRGIDADGTAGEYCAPQSFETKDSSFMTFMGVGGGLALLLLAIF